MIPRLSPCQISFIKPQKQYRYHYNYLSRKPKYAKTTLSNIVMDEKLKQLWFKFSLEHHKIGQCQKKRDYSSLQSYKSFIIDTVFEHAAQVFKIPSYKLLSDNYKILNNELSKLADSLKQKNEKFEILMKNHENLKTKFDKLNNFSSENELTIYYKEKYHSANTAYFNIKQDLDNYKNNNLFQFERVKSEYNILFSKYKKLEEYSKNNELQNSELQKLVKQTKYSLSLKLSENICIKQNIEKLKNELKGLGAFSEQSMEHSHRLAQRIIGRKGHSLGKGNGSDDILSEMCLVQFAYQQTKMHKKKKQKKKSDPKWFKQGLIGDKIYCNNKCGTIIDEIGTCDDCTHEDFGIIQALVDFQSKNGPYKLTQEFLNKKQNIQLKSILKEL